MQVAPHTVHKSQKDMRDCFRVRGLATPDLDARLLVAAATHKTPTQLITDGDATLAPHQSQMLARWRKARLAGMPIARILGAREFYGLPFKISAAVLDPRPDSECLVDAALTFYGAPQNKTQNRFLDLGTGSGCLAIAILYHAPHLRALGVDVSRRALRIARINAARLQVRDRLALRQSSWTRGVAGRFDFIIANPPYIARRDLAHLPREVRDYDPYMALDGGTDGLVHYRIIAARAPHFLRQNGRIFLEIGGGAQAQNVKTLLAKSGFVNIAIKSDLTACPRLVIAQYKPTIKRTKKGFDI